METLTTRANTSYRPQTPHLKVRELISWEHHRTGWSYVCDLVQEHLVTDDGVLFISAIEDHLRTRGMITEPWVGFIHQLPKTDLPNFPDLTRLLEMPAWEKSLKYCRGLWTLADYNRQFLIQQGVEVPISTVPYPSPMDVRTFSWQAFANTDVPVLLHVGEYQRRYQFFFDLPAFGYQKVMLQPEDFDSRRTALNMNESVELVPTISNEDYDDWLTHCVLFLDFVDAGANTTIVECITRGTPILVNPVGGVTEYLGPEYPLYFSDITEAEHKLQDRALLQRAHQYLQSMDKTRFTGEGFLNAMTDSTVYRALPTPASQQTRFRQRAVTILLSTYQRLYNLQPQLERYCQQDYDEPFEILVWNNNDEIAEQVRDIVGRFSNKLDIRFINSGENYFCMMRLAAPALANSEILLICDDDVMPATHYISSFVRRYQELGKEVGLCLRGHVFHPHTLDEDQPSLAWCDERDFSFYDEAAEECQIHFAHADNMLIPVHLLREAALFPLTHPEYALVDDYWLSYILNGKLGVPIIKMQGEDLMQFTDCANDPNIALYHNPAVREQRIRLYIEHMRAGWPDFSKP